MSSTVFTQALDLACGAFLLTAVATLWRHNLVAIVQLAATQAVVLAAVTAFIGLRTGDVGMYATAAGVLLLNGALIPAALGRVLRRQPSQSTPPLVNVAASMVAAVLLTLLAYAVSRPVIGLAPPETASAIPLGLAVVFLGFFTLVTRRPAIAQTVGFVLLVNGVTATALLTTGSAVIVAMTVSLNVLLFVWMLTIDERAKFDGADPDDLRQLRH